MCQLAAVSNDSMSHLSGIPISATRSTSSGLTIRFGLRAAETVCNVSHYSYSSVSAMYREIQYCLREHQQTMNNAADKKDPGRKREAVARGHCGCTQAESTLTHETMEMPLWKARNMRFCATHVAMNRRHNETLVMRKSHFHKRRGGA